LAEILKNIPALRVCRRQAAGKHLWRNYQRLYPVVKFKLREYFLY